MIIDNSFQQTGFKKTWCLRAIIIDFPEYRIRPGSFRWVYDILSTDVPQGKKKDTAGGQETNQEVDTNLEQ